VAAQMVSNPARVKMMVASFRTCPSSSTITANRTSASYFKLVNQE
jgi:hypothetical protein